MKDSDKKVLLVVAAIAIVVLAYMYVISPTKTKIDNLNSEISTLQAKYNDLKSKEAKRDQYEKEIKEFNEAFEKELVDYPADLNQETTVMFLKGVEQNVEFTHRSIQMGAPATFYILGQGAIGADSQVVVDANAQEEQYICQKAEFPISFTGTYEGVKNYLNYLANYKYKSNISSISVQYDPLMEMCSGTVTLDTYSVAGPNRTPDTVQTDVMTGIPNIFTGGSGSSIVTTTDKYAATQGSEIAASHNLIVLLNNAANDTTSGIVIASNEGDEATFVTSSDNAVADVKITVYAADGKNYADYAIGSKKYTTEILTADFTVYVKSSNRVDGADVNGVNVSVDNTTTIPVYFKVAGDDTTSPRFNIGSKSGTVKVY